jgi:hypothetical protein
MGTLDMKKMLCILMLIIGITSPLFAIEIYKENQQYNAGIKIYITNNKYEQGLNAIVYITDSKSEAGDKWYLWHYTKDKYEKGVTRAYFTDRKYDADWIIYIAKHKSEAKWIK